MYTVDCYHCNEEFEWREDSEMLCTNCGELLDPTSYGIEVEKPKKPKVALRNRSKGKSGRSTAQRRPAKAVRRPKAESKGKSLGLKVMSAVACLCLLIGGCTGLVMVGDALDQSYKDEAFSKLKSWGYEGDELALAREFVLVFHNKSRNNAGGTSSKKSISRIFPDQEAYEMNMKNLIASAMKDLKAPLSGLSDMGLGNSQSHWIVQNPPEGVNVGTFHLCLEPKKGKVYALQEAGIDIFFRGDMSIENGKLSLKAEEEDNYKEPFIIDKATVYKSSENYTVLKLNKKYLILSRKQSAGLVMAKHFQL